jgi:hypothetical protein
MKYYLITLLYLFIIFSEAKELTIWNSKTIENAIKKVYGNEYSIYKHIKANYIVYSMSDAYISIKSKIELESVSIFSNTNKLATIAIINVPKNWHPSNPIRQLKKKKEKMLN